MIEKTKVFFIKLNEIEKIKNLLPEFGVSPVVKVHFGERGCDTFVPAKYIKQITDNLDQPTFIETSVLYKSQRRTASGHLDVEKENGFDWLTIDFLDGEEGDDFIEIKIKGNYFSECYLGRGLEKYKELLVISHFKGHGGSGFGGAIKNLGMGLASRKGKLAMHASIKHNIQKEKCISCGSCISHCPVSAIEFDDNKKAFIKQHKCISCSKCISVCPVGAVKIPWGSTGRKELGEKIAEYAYAAQLNRKCFYINFLINITKECDCNDVHMEPVIPDIGILASSDPVAIDQASYDLAVKQSSAAENFNSDPQLHYAEEIGLGSRDYELINL